MSRVLIAGCGFVGEPAAGLFQKAGWEVVALTHSQESAERLRSRGWAVHAGDITDAADVARLREAVGEVDAIVDCVSSGRGGADRYRAVYLEGARRLIDAFAAGRFVFTSSTSVYAQNAAEWVDESSPAEPDRETGRILRETEDLVLASGGTVARLAGIYGPGRTILLRKFLSGEAIIEGGGDRYLNQIHRDDAGAALLHLVAHADGPGIFNVADNEPATQFEVYRWLATTLGRPLPPAGPVDPNRKRGVTNKRVSNARLRQLGWSPIYGSFREGYSQVLQAEHSSAWVP